MKLVAEEDLNIYAVDLLKGLFFNMSLKSDDGRNFVLFPPSSEFSYML